ncbi:MAG: ATP-binding protein [Lachnospiraceae bacterium]|nr:ATP-binding protein [Lachnospiraceae bacterium]
MKAYIKRVIDGQLQEELEAIGAVLLEGPKWCGKTSSAEQLAKSALYMGDPETRLANRMRAETDPVSLLNGDTPRLIDEWQIAAHQIWNTVRAEVDRRDAFSQFILTGSATPPKMSDDAHSGIGRIKPVRMRTMSLFESGESSGSVSLSGFFQTNDTPLSVRGTSEKKLEDIAYLLCRGGWPRAVTADTRRIALKQAKNYHYALIHQELKDENDHPIPPKRVALILRAYARHTGTPASFSTILTDCLAHTGRTFSEDTLANDIRKLTRLFVFEDITAWNPNLRSKTAIRTSPVRFFTDPSIATASLGTGPEAMCKDIETFGLLFENMAVRDLRIYAEAANGTVYHYRDKNGLECDAVIVLRDGRYGLIEIKLGGDSWIEEGAKTLNKIERIIDTSRMGAPAFKMVLCGVSPAAYRRPDNVCVVPIDCLAP